MPTGPGPKIWPGIASLTVSAVLPSSDVAQNILHFMKNDLTAWGTGDLTNLVNSFDTWLGTTNGKKALTDHMATSVTITNLLARDHTVDGGAEYGKTVTHAGSQAGNILASGLTFAITLRTGLVGRSYRGRIFLIGLTAPFTITTPDTVLNTAADDVVSGWNDLITVAEGWSPAMKWVVLSKQHANAWRATGIGTPIVTTGYSELVLDYQRRRAPYHARHH